MTTRCDALRASLDIPLPEMLFGHNLLQNKQYPSRVDDALRGVKSGPLEDGDGGDKVGYAGAWLRAGEHSLVFLASSIVEHPAAPG